MTRQYNPYSFVGNPKLHKTITIDSIIQDVERYVEYDILVNSRLRMYVDGRQLASYLIVYFLDLPYVEIGERLAGRGHDTVIYSIKTFQNNIDTCRRFRDLHRKFFEGYGLDIDKLIGFDIQEQKHNNKK